ncbi:hypothetical protein H0X10_03785 [Candidatus Saccharibacteria bacterium]|nr:hypothetical protein [Candidatus Saccharibacteria bacterium]
MTAQRSRKEELEYRNYHKKIKESGKFDACVFCSIKNDSEQIIEQTKYFRVITNIFPYSIWDNERVSDHLMIIPKTHTAKLGVLPTPAASEFLKLIDVYEDKGYNLYARSPGSTIKSIPHQHSHLIKPGGHRRKLVFYAKKPYFRVSF